MLTRFFLHFKNPHPPYVRPMDYLDEILAMKRRHERNSAAWRPHLDATRRIVLSAAGRCRNRSKLVLLGAGLLLDAPIEELSVLFKEVVLLDIVILPEVRKSVERLENVRLVQCDVTNMAGKLYTNIQQGVRELPQAVPALPEIDGQTGLVVSLNILSQLWVIPRAYALKKLAGLPEEEVDDWCRQVVASHYACLLALPCPVWLVGDYEFVQRDGEKNVVSRGSTVCGLALPSPGESWTWNIAPREGSGRFLSKELIVGAWQLR